MSVNLFQIEALNEISFDEPACKSISRIFMFVKFFKGAGGTILGFENSSASSPVAVQSPTYLIPLAKSILQLTLEDSLVLFSILMVASNIWSPAKALSEVSPAPFKYLVGPINTTEYW
ncbi:MAG: hypothetical protein ACRCWG_13945 [Sarcina sp.]